MKRLDILKKVPYQDFDLYQDRPMYASIKNVHDKLSANASFIHSILSDGRHGLLGLIITPAILTNQPWSLPDYTS